MLDLLKASSEKKLQDKYEKLLEKAMQFQRNGDTKNYAMASAEAEKIRGAITRLQASVS